MPEIDLDELAAWLRSGTRPCGDSKIEPHVRPADLQARYHLTFSDACRALETLDRRGVLDRVPGTALAWKLASAPPRPGKGYALPLFQAEHGALLRLLDERLRIERDYARVTTEQGKADIKALRAVRSRLLGKEKP